MCTNIIISPLLVKPEALSAHSVHFEPRKVQLGILKDLDVSLS